LSRACDKTGLDAARLETVVENLELQLQQRTSKEVASSEIGELVLKSSNKSAKSPTSVSHRCTDNSAESTILCPPSKR
jgi:transcriptional regulator NrdR family protein